MGLLRYFQIESMKLKHTSFFLFQLGSTFFCLFFWGSYFQMYGSQAEETKFQLIFEILATLLPVICSISTAYLVRQEEQIPNLYGMLSVSQRGKAVFMKVMFAWMVGNISLFIQFLGIVVLCSHQHEVILKLISRFGGLVVFSLFFYIFHFFLNLKYGIGMSLFWGIFESMQAVIYSNIKLSGGFKFIPFAWLMEWNQGVQEATLVENKNFWGLCILLMLLLLFLFVQWFSCWEGRRYYGAQ
jgi:hypothetical protein